MLRTLLILAAWMLAPTPLLADGPAAQPASQPASQPIQLETFSSDQYRFTMDYPASWTVLEHPVNHQVLSMQTQPANATDKNLGVMGLRIADGPAAGSDEEILQTVSGEMVDYLFNHGGKKITIHPEKLGDIPARRIRCSTDQPAGATTAIYIIAVHNRTEYVFTIAAPADQIDKMLPGVDAVLKSFKLLE
jgi:hypothetical protein